MPRSYIYQVVCTSARCLLGPLCGSKGCLEAALVVCPCWFVETYLALFSYASLSQPRSESIYACSGVLGPVRRVVHLCTVLRDPVCLARVQSVVVPSWRTIAVTCLTLRAVCVQSVPWSGMMKESTRCALIHPFTGVLSIAILHCKMCYCNLVPSIDHLPNKAPFKLISSTYVR